MVDNIRTAVATAAVATPKASSYLQQLCKHFAHKVPASFEGSEGRISFAMGDCMLRASPEGVLSMTVSAATDADLKRVQEVVGSHLERFAFRETLRIEWM